MLPATRNALSRAVRQTPVPVRCFSQSLPARGPLFTEFVNKLRTEVKEISPKELHDKIGADGPPPSFHILDVRETDEWNKNALPYALYTGRGNLERDIEQYVPDNFDVIILYCSGGNRSIVAADSLKQMGYQNVYSLQGGLSKWESEGYKVLKNSRVYADRVEYFAHEKDQLRKQGSFYVRYDR
ncbi:hypothetical protein HDV00_008003 [Rhizophlyctis rosea]|nr:hypothetical protein HDV00_008003 [Rhizophlyctis rosea]